MKKDFKLCSVSLNFNDELKGTIAEKFVKAIKKEEFKRKRALLILIKKLL